MLKREQLLHIIQITDLYELLSSKSINTLSASFCLSVPSQQAFLRLEIWSLQDYNLFASFCSPL